MTQSARKSARADWANTNNHSSSPKPWIKLTQMRTIADDILYHHRAKEHFSAGNALVELEEHCPTTSRQFRGAILLLPHQPCDSNPEWSPPTIWPRTWWPASYPSLSGQHLSAIYRWNPVHCVMRLVWVSLWQQGATSVRLSTYLNHTGSCSPSCWSRKNGYNATKIRIHHRAMGTLIGLILAAGLLHLQMPEGTTLSIMLVITLLCYLVQRKNYGLSVIGRTITTVRISCSYWPEKGLTS